MAKHHKTDKTLVEKMLDKAGIAYVPYEFPTEEVGVVALMNANRCVGAVFVPCRFHEIFQRYHADFAIAGNLTQLFIINMPI